MSLLKRRSRLLIVCLGLLVLVAAPVTSVLAGPPQTQQDDNYDDDTLEPGDKKKKKNKKKRTEPIDREALTEPTNEGGMQDAGAATPERRPSEPSGPDRALGFVPDSPAPMGRPADAGPDAGPAAMAPDTGVTPPDTTSPPPSAAPMGRSGPGTSSQTTGPPVAKGFGFADLKRKQDDFANHERAIVWVAAACIALAFAFFLLQLLLPIAALGFLGWVGSTLLFVGGVILAGVMGYRSWLTAELPGISRWTGGLWFAQVAIFGHLIRKRQLPKVHITGLPLALVVCSALVWSLAGPYDLADAAALPLYSSPLFRWSQWLLYTTFGFLAAAGSWLVMSGFLGLLAKRNMGTGYGLEPRKWNQLQLQPSFFVLMSFPLLTLSWILFSIWSLATFGQPVRGYWAQPQQWASVFCWFMLVAYLFSLRRPKTATAFDDAVVTPTNTFPSFLLLLTTVGTAVIFVGASSFLRLLG